VNDLIAKSIINRKFLLFLFISFCTLLIHGLNIKAYFVYSVLRNHYLTHQAIYALDTLGGLSPIPLGLLARFTTFFTYTLQAPLPWIVVSIIIKAALMFTVYRIFSIWLKKDMTTLWSSLIFCLSVEFWTHGSVHNGIWGGPFFYNGSVSTLFLLLGMFLFLKNKWIWGALLGGLAIQLHPFNSFASLSFFIPSLLYNSFKQGELVFKKSTIPIIIIMASAFHLLLKTETSAAPRILSTVQEWHDFVVAVNWDDMSLLHTLLNYGTVLVPLLMGTVCIVCSRKMTKEIDRYFIVALIIFCFFLGIESLHFLGVQWGKLSEYFITVEFRRGLWVLMLFSFVIIVDFLVENSKIIIAKKRYIFLIVLFANCFLLPSFAVCLVFLLALLLLWPNKYSTTLFFSFSVIFGVYYFAESFPPHIFTRSIKTLSYVTFSATTIMAFFLLLKKHLNITEVFKYSIISFLTIGTLAGIYREKLLNDYLVISVDGPFAYPDSKKIMRNILKLKEINFNEHAVEKLIKLNKERELILLPHAMSRYSFLFDKMPVFLGLDPIGMATISKGYYDHLKFELAFLTGEKLDGKGLVAIFGEELKYNKFIKYDKFLKNVPLNRLKKFHERGIRFVVRDKLSGRLTNKFKPVYSSETFEVYDLNVLRNF
jgi:hypothetical protein